MDPTKPILDLYGDSFYSVKQRQQKQAPKQSSSLYNQNSNSKYFSASSNYGKKFVNEPVYQQTDKYQQLYQAYEEKSSKLSYYQSQNSQLRNQNSKLKQKVEELLNKNQELNETILHKNSELEDVYRKLQEQIKLGRPNGRTNDGAIDKLEDGLREAINSNFQILRESALSELKHFIQ